MPIAVALTLSGARLADRGRLSCRGPLALAIPLALALALVDAATAGLRLMTFALALGLALTALERVAGRVDARPGAGASAADGGNHRQCAQNALETVSSRKPEHERLLAEDRYAVG